MNDTVEQKGQVVFYCKDCEEIVETNRVGKKFVYKCKKCDTKNVAFGTEKSIRGFFRLDEKEAAAAQEKKDAAKRGRAGKTAPVVEKEAESEEAVPEEAV